MNQNKLKFIDLFAGIGAMRAPFSKMGDVCLFSSEIDKFAQQTYKTFYNETPAGDITKIDPESLPDADLLLAGFPCQSFSTAGLCKGFADTRGEMFFYIEKILEAKNYPIVFLENVKNLMYIKKSKVFEYILNALKKQGYFVKYKLIKASEFGNLQPRERVYILAFKDENLFNKFEFPTPPTQTRQAILKDYLEPSNEVAEKYTLSKGRIQSYKNKNIRFSARGHNNFKHYFYDKKTTEIKTFTTVGLTSSRMLINEDKSTRRITPAEAAAVQGIDANLIKKASKAGVSDHQLYKQIGNSVAVPVIEAIAKNLKQAINQTQQNLNIPPVLLNKVTQT